MDNKKEFKPFIPADKVMPEFTVASVIIGLILAVYLVQPMLTLV